MLARVAVPLALAATLLVGASACTPSRPAPTKPGTPTPTESPAPSTSPTPSAEPSSAAVALAELRIELRPVVSGLRAPLLVTHAGDGSGRLFVVEQGGLVRVAREGKFSSRPFLDVRSKISTGGERGLLGLAFAEDYEISGRFWVNYTDRNGDTIVERYVADDPASDNPRLGSRRVDLKVTQPYANHNGGGIAFAPDGTLWVGMGDGGSAGDPQGRAQRRGELLGKMLSLDVTGEGRPKPRIVSSGLRNPWRFSFDRKNGDLWIADVGQEEFEEVDRVPWADAVGKNYGWNLWEGDHPYPPGSSPSRDGFTFPVIEYGRDEGYSITGGFVYRGSEYPEMDGTYFYADFGSGFVAGARVLSSGKVRSRVLIRDSGTTPSSFGEGEDGELYLVDYNGRVLQVTASR